MSQKALSFPLEKYSGANLMSDLPSILQALASCRAGAARPADVQTPELWIQTVSGTVWKILVWDGAQDILIGQLNPVTHAWTPAGAVADNDARLTNSRQCNNAFDDATAARNALGLKSAALLDAAALAQLGVVGAYTRQQYAVPVAVAPAAGAVTLDAQLHQEAEITSTVALTMNAPTNGVKGMRIFLRLYAATALAIAWNAVFKANADVALPTAHVAGKGLYLDFRYDGASWVLMGKVVEA